MGCVLQNRITSSQRFTVSGYTVTFAAGMKRGNALVVFGVHTGLESVPVFTLEKTYKSLEEAERYVHGVSCAAAEKLLTHYQEHYQAMTEQVDRAFSRESTGFIAPDKAPGRYPTRGYR